jgi:hypothetical protein
MPSYAMNLLQKIFYNDIALHVFIGIGIDTQYLNENLEFNDFFK